MDQLNKKVVHDAPHDDAKWVFISSQANSSNLIRYSENIIYL
jgi:hypothetical protein